MNTDKSQNDEKFTSLYKAYVDDVYHFIFMRTGLDKSVAEDLTQEIFIEVYKGLARFKGRSSQRTWIFSIARNRLNDFYRRQYRPLFDCKNLDDTLGEQFESDAPNAEELQIKEFEQQSVRACLLGLNEQYRIVLTLKYIDGSSVKDIAKLFGKTPKAIESMLNRAKNSFIKAYTQLREKEEL